MVGYRVAVATLLAHITVKDGTESAFEKIARHLFVTSHEQELGLVRYEYWRGSKPRTYYAHLSFVDFAAFIAHQTSEHHESASPEIGSIVEQIELEWVDPVEGASPLVPTVSQDLSSADDDLTRRYARIFEARISSWWLPFRSP